MVKFWKFKLKNEQIHNLKISVVMTTFNGSIYVKDQIDSIINQIGEFDELIISDDCSDDDTVNIIESYYNKQVRIIKNSTRLGPIQNFEISLRNAHGDIIVLSDQDDQWLPGRIEKIREYFSNRQNKYDLLMMNSIVTDKSLSPIKESLFDYLNSGPGIIKNLYKNTYVGCHMSFRRALLDVALPFPTGIPMHDMWLGLVSETVGPVTFVSQPTMLWRRHEHNYTRSGHSFGQRLKWRISLTNSLISLLLSARYRNRP